MASAVLVRNPGVDENEQRMEALAQALRALGHAIPPVSRREVAAAAMAKLQAGLPVPYRDAKTSLFTAMLALSEHDGEPTLSLVMNVKQACLELLRYL